MSRIKGFIGRRDLLKFVGVGGFAIAATAAYPSLVGNIQKAAVADTSAANLNSVSCDEALKRLLDGNQRFLHQRRKYPNQSLEHLLSVAQAQYPFASILGCADSRVPAEIVFDQGLGDLFVVRVAGNVASDTAIGSLEYSTAILGSNLIVVLGHTRCGAVAQALEEKPVPGRIGFIIESIKPAIERVMLRTGDIQENAVIANIQYQAEKLQESSTIVSKLVSQGKLKIVGACYDIDTGEVSMVT